MDQTDRLASPLHGPLTCHECHRPITGPHWGHGGLPRHTVCVNWAETKAAPYAWRLKDLRKVHRQTNDPVTRKAISEFGSWLKAISDHWPANASAELVTEIHRRNAEIDERLKHRR